MPLFNRKAKRNGEISALENMIADKDAEIVKLTQRVANISRDRDAASREAQHYLDQMKDLGGQITEYQDKIDDLNADNRELTVVVGGLQKSLDRTAADLATEKKSNANLRDRLAAENLKVTKLEAENRKLSDQVSEMMIASNDAANAPAETVTKTTKRPTIK